MSYETQFSTYAVPLIMGEIKRFLRDDGLIKVSRSLKDIAMKIRLATEFYFEKNGVEPTVSEIAKHLKVSEDDVVMALEIQKPTESLNAVVNEGDKNPVYLIDRVCGNDDEREKEFDKMLVRELIAELKPKEQQLIQMRYFRGATQMKVADMLGISQVQVSRMEKKILNEMKTRLVE